MTQPDTNYEASNDPLNTHDYSATDDVGALVDDSAYNIAQEHLTNSQNYTKEKDRQNQGPLKYEVGELEGKIKDFEGFWVEKLGPLIQEKKKYLAHKDLTGVKKVLHTFGLYGAPHVSDVEAAEMVMKDYSAKARKDMDKARQYHSGAEEALKGHINKKYEIDFKRNEVLSDIEGLKSHIESIEEDTTTKSRSLAEYKQQTYQVDYDGAVDGLITDLEGKVQRNMDLRNKMKGQLREQMSNLRTYVKSTQRFERRIQGAEKWSGLMERYSLAVEEKADVIDEFYGDQSRIQVMKEIMVDQSAMASMSGPEKDVLDQLANTMQTIDGLSEVIERQCQFDLDLGEPSTKDDDILAQAMEMRQR